MKKRLLALTLALALVAVFAACSSDSGVVGTWSIDLSASDGTQNFSQLIGVSNSETYIIGFIFRDDGYYMANVGSVHGDHVHDAQGDVSGQYTLEDGTLIFDGEVRYTCTVSGSTMTITDDNGNSFRYTK